MDENYYVLNVKVRENLTDMRAVERMKAWNFIMKEWQAYIKVTAPFYNKYAERIVRFLWNMTRWIYVRTYLGHMSLLKKLSTKKVLKSLLVVLHSRRAH